MRRSSAKAILISIVLLFTSGCASVGWDTAYSGYTTSNINEIGNDSLRIAILPLNANSGEESFRRSAGKVLAQSIADKNLNMQVVAPDVTARIISKKGLSKIYADMMYTYDRTGILDKNTLTDMAGPLGCDYFLYADATVDITVAEKFLFTRSIIHGQVWDVQLGDVAWEGRSDITREGANSNNSLKYASERPAQVYDLKTTQKAA